MPDIFSITDPNNKVKYLKLLDLIIGTPIQEFVDKVRWPFLIGQELYEGELSKKGDGWGTFEFVMAERGKESETGASAIHRAIYLLAKTDMNQTGQLNRLDIGRSPNNDITIVDYAISKNHARVSFIRGDYFIEDMGSTNGVFVSDVRLSKKLRVPLSNDIQVRFGRFSFIFSSPLNLYIRIRKILSLSLPNKKDLAAVLDIQRPQVLRKIMTYAKLDLDESLSREEVIKSILEQISTEDIIDGLIS